LHVVDLAERGAPRRVDEPPEERAQRPLERRRQLSRSIDEAVELTEPEAGVVRGRPATRAEIRLLSARVERVAAELEREHLEREIEAVRVDVGLVLLAHGAALGDDVEELRGGARDERPRLLE